MLLEMVLGIIISSLFIYIAGKVLDRKTGYLVFLIAMLCTLIISLKYPVLNSYEEYYSWSYFHQSSLNLGFKIDGLSWAYGIVICIVFSMVSLYSMPYIAWRFKSVFPTYYSLYLLIFAGLLGLLFATNILQFYIFFELMIIPSWALIHLYGYNNKERIALTFFIWSQISGMLILIGFIGSYLQSNSFELKIIGYHNQWFVFIGFAIKIALLGFHYWLPPTYAEAPIVLSTIMGSVMTGIGSYGMLRLNLPLIKEYGSLLAIWAIAAMIYGALLALFENDLKRIIAYSSMSQMGYIFLGISAYSNIALTGAVFHYVSHALLKAVLFMSSGIIIFQINTKNIKDMGGLAAKMPLTALCYISAFLSLAGFPPFSAFHSKLVIFTGVFETLSPGLAITALVSTFLTLSYTAIVIRKTMFGEYKGNKSIGLRDIHGLNLMILSMLTLLVISIALFIYPWILMRPLSFGGALP